MADIKAIRQRMQEKELTVGQVSTALSMNQSTFYRKAGKNGATFSLEQVQVLAKILGLSPQEAQAIFFPEKGKKLFAVVRGDAT